MQIYIFHRRIKKRNEIMCKVCFMFKSLPANLAYQIMSICSCFHSIMLNLFIIHHLAPARSWHNYEYWFWRLKCWKQTLLDYANTILVALQWRRNHQPRDCLLNRLFRLRSKKISKLRVTGLCVGNSPGIGEFPAQMASSAENVSIWWRHHG